MVHFTVAGCRYTPAELGDEFDEIYARVEDLHLELPELEKYPLGLEHTRGDNGVETAFDQRTRRRLHMPGWSKNEINTFRTLMTKAGRITGVNPKTFKRDKKHQKGNNNEEDSDDDADAEEKTVANRRDDKVAEIVDVLQQYHKIAEARDEIEGDARNPTVSALIRKMAGEMLESKREEAGKLWKKIINKVETAGEAFQTADRAEVLAGATKEETKKLTDRWSGARYYAGVVAAHTAIVGAYQALQEPHQVSKSIVGDLEANVAHYRSENKKSLEEYNALKANTRQAIADRQRVFDCSEESDDEYEGGIRHQRLSPMTKRARARWQEAQAVDDDDDDDDDFEDNSGDHNNKRRRLNATPEKQRSLAIEEIVSRVTAAQEEIVRRVTAAQEEDIVSRVTAAQEAFMDRFIRNITTLAQSRGIQVTLPSSSAHVEEA